jgi:glycosyltransferase involved in cell wall biosynthesis
MKLLYACSENAHDRNVWSGLVWHIWKALEQGGVEVELFDQVPMEYPLHIRAIHNYHKRLARRYSHYLGVEPVILKKAASRIEERCRQRACTAVFCPGTGYPVNAYIDPAIPVISYSDATKQTWLRHYFGWNSFCKRTQQQVKEVDKVALSNNTLTIFSSDWAARLAVAETGTSPEKVAVVPFGANLVTPPSDREIEVMIRDRGIDPCRLLFIGVGWERKGGSKALKLLSELRGRGINAQLDVVGCEPSVPDDLRPFIRSHGYVDKSKPEGHILFKGLLAHSHFLLLFSKAEAFGLSLCEANAYGVPCIAQNLGGPAEIVIPNVNGLLISPFSDLTDAADWALAQLTTPESYARLARSARSEYNTRLNWRVSGQRLRSLIEGALDRHKQSGFLDIQSPSRL